jgi:hypothetical protein
MHGDFLVRRVPRMQDTNLFVLECDFHVGGIDGYRVLGQGRGRCCERRE